MPNQIEERVTEQNYIQLFSQTPAPIAIYKGRELRYVFVNEAYSKIFNYRDILGKTVREAFPELAGQIFFEILENVFDTGEPFYGNETPALIDADNDGKIQTRYYNLVYTPFRNQENIIEGIMACGFDVTDQVMSRKKEKESDIRFKNIVEQSVDPILILKGEDLVLDVANEPLFSLWNVNRNAIGKKFLDILPEMKEQGFFDLLLDVYHNGITHYGHEVPVVFNRSGGEQEMVYFDFVYQPYREADGNISGVLILATTVTKQVLVREKIKQNEYNFRNTILKAPVALCVLRGADHVVEIANNKMFHLWGKQEADVINKPIFEGLPEARGQGLEKLLDTVLMTGEHFTASERPVQLPRGDKIETIYINFVYEPMKEADGTIPGIMVVAVEVTDQVVARQKIEYAEERARLAVESADLGTFEINLQTDEVIASPRFHQIYDLDQTNNRAEYLEKIHPEDLLQRDKAYKESQKTGILEYESRVQWKDKTEHWVRVKGKIFQDEKGNNIKLLGVAQDITEQKISAQHLEGQVAARTLELSIANKELQKSNGELEQFAHVSSHDLQEPLRKIRMFTEMIHDSDYEKLSDHSKTKFDKIIDAVQRMSTSLKDLLNFTSLTREEQLAEVKLNEVMLGVLNDLELMVIQKEAVVITDPLPTIRAVPLQMHQLFYNLMNNALKFSRPGVAPEVKISWSFFHGENGNVNPIIEPGKKYIEIILRDNGIGFEQAHADKIFNMFQRLHNRQHYSGTGIGLALCRKVVENHKGFIFANSRPGIGTSFHIVLPYPGSES